MRTPIKNRWFLPILFLTITVEFFWLIVFIKITGAYIDVQLERRVQRVVAFSEQVLYDTMVAPHSSPPTDARPYMAIVESQPVVMMADGVSIPVSISAIPDPLRATYVQHEGQYYDMSGSPVALPDAYLTFNQPTDPIQLFIFNFFKGFHLTMPFKDRKDDGKWYRRFLYEHDRIRGFHLELDILQHALVKKRQYLIMGVIASLILLNGLLIAIIQVVFHQSRGTWKWVIDAIQGVINQKRGQPTPLNVSTGFYHLSNELQGVLMQIYAIHFNLIQKKKALDQVVQYFPYAMIILNGDYEVTLTNRKAESMLMASISDDDTVLRLVNELKTIGALELVSSDRQYFKQHPLVHSIWMRDGRTHCQYEIDVVPYLKDNDGPRCGGIVVIRDVTHDRVYASKKHMALRYLVNDLKIPLTSIIGFLTVLKNKLQHELSHQHQRFLSISIQTAYDINQRVLTILNALTVQQTTVLKQPHCLNHAVREALKQHDPPLSWTTQFESPDQCIMMDKSHMQAVLASMVSFAQYYLDSSTIHIQTLYEHYTVVMNVEGSLNHSVSHEDVHRARQLLMPMVDALVGNLADTDLIMVIVIVGMYGGTVEFRPVEASVALNGGHSFDSTLRVVSSTSHAHFSSAKSMWRLSVRFPYFEGRNTCNL